MIELSKNYYGKVEKLFTRLKTSAAIESIFNYKNEARLFVDNFEQPKTVFIINSWAYYYLAGDSENDVFNTLLVEFLENDFFPECIRTNQNTVFAFYPDTDEWCIRIQQLFSHLELAKSGKTYFKYNENEFDENWRKKIPDGFSVKRINRELIDSMINNKEFVDYIICFWESLEKYFEKGMGYCSVDSEDFATVCISVFASDNEREIGIKTFQNFQRQGLAYVTACAYIEECLNNRLIPVWSCFSENEISVNLAKKLGYTIEATHPIYFANIGQSGI